MSKQDGNQYNVPENKPKGKGSEPHDEDRTDIRQGAQQQDQLKDLAPDGEDDRAPNKSGTPPHSDTNNGSGQQ